MTEGLTQLTLLVAFIVIVLDSAALFDFSFAGDVERIVVRAIILRAAGITCGVLALKSSVIGFRILACSLIVIAALLLPFLVRKFWSRRRFHWREERELETAAEKAKKQNCYGDAEKIYRKILEKQRSGYFVQDDSFQWELASILVQQKKYNEGIALYRTVIQNEKATLKNLSVLASHTQNLAYALKRAKRFVEARESYEAVIDLNLRSNQSDGWSAMVCRKQLASVLNALGESEQARVQESEANAILLKHKWEYTTCPDEECDGKSHFGMSDQKTLIQSVDVGALATLVYAIEERVRARRTEVSPELLFLGLVRNTRDKPGQMFQELGVTINEARLQFKKLVKRNDVAEPEQEFSKHCKQLLLDAKTKAESRSQARITNKCLLYALIDHAQTSCSECAIFTLLHRLRLVNDLGQPTFIELEDD